VYNNRLAAQGVKLIDLGNHTVRVGIGVLLALLIIALASLAYAEQDALLLFVENNIRSLPPYQSALIIVAWVSIGTLILIPNTVLFVTSGSLFGFWWAFTFNLIGFGLGASIAFLISRYGFYEFVRLKAHTMLQTFNNRFSKAGWKAVAVVRLTPVFPSFAVNYLLGITHVRFFDYLWASVVFTLPACITMTLFGDVSVALLLQSEPSPLVITGFILLFVAVAIAVAFTLKRRATNAR
jgi:uncharacterized membrane protein YdjX (TVP38/TMEM64 family)